MKHMAYSEVVRQILQTIQSCPQSDNPRKVAYHRLSLRSSWFKLIVNGGDGNFEINGSRKRGYPRHDWTSKLVAYMRFQQLGDWQMLAQDRPLWMQLSDDFVKFCCRC